MGVLTKLQNKMGHSGHMITILAFIFVINCQTDYIYHSPSRTGACAGSVTLYNESEETLMTIDDTNMKMNVDRAVVEGCGCFTLHTRRGGRGRTYFLGREG